MDLVMVLRRYTSDIVTLMLLVHAMFSHQTYLSHGFSVTPVSKHH